MNLRDWHDVAEQRYQSATVRMSNNKASLLLYLLASLREAAAPRQGCADNRPID
jgi:hypothetical protein